VSEAGFVIQRMTYNNFFVFPMATPLILTRRGSQREPQLATPSTDEDAYQVEMEPTSPPINAILTAVGRVEAAVLRFASFPVGTSIICIARKGPVLVAGQSADVVQ
jgi:hypothetical protein